MTLPHDVVFPATPFQLADSLIILGQRGSEAHGTYVPPTDPNAIDDRDLMGVVIQPPEGYLGLSNWEGTEAINGPWDVVLYDLRKFVRLLTRQNPNVLSLLWMDRPGSYPVLTGAGVDLCAARALFRARQPFYDSFVGYARGQLHKMTTVAGLGYQGDKRRRLFERFGYDCKNAAHLVRLLTMGIEFLREGTLHVYREQDRQMLIDIKSGKWTQAEVTKYADKLFQDAEAALATSCLPEAVDLEAAEDLTVDLIQRWWYGA